MNMLEAKQYLGIFERYNDLLQDEFREYGTIIEFTKNNHPFTPDETLKWFFVIISGKVKIYDMNFDTGREQTLYLLVRGDMYDTVPLLDNKPHDLASEVLEKGKAIKFPLVKVREWMRKFPKFEQLMYSYIAKQMRHTEELALDLSLLETKERLLKLLLKNVDTIEQKGVGLLDKLSHAEIANLIGTVRHIIDRHFKDLKNEGIIEKGKAGIELKKLHKVLEMLHNY